MSSPIALFVYNRPNHTRQTVEALQKNTLATESDLYIFSDGPKHNSTETVAATRAYLRTITGFKSVSIQESEVNRGLATSIISGVSKVLEKHETIVVVEDDLVTSPYFLSFLNQALEIYRNDEQVVCINGYFYPVGKVLPQSFFIKGADCQGWATWRRGWAHFDPDGKKLLREIRATRRSREFNHNNSYPFSRMLYFQQRGMIDSWAIRWYASAFLKNKLTLYPGVSMLKNIGFDGSGVNSTVADEKIYDTVVETNEVRLERIAVKENIEVRKILEDYYRATRKPFMLRVKERLFSMMRKLVSR